MVDSEKRENLANARRKLKKFRDQQPNISPANDSDIHSINGINQTSNESTINYNIMPQTRTSFANEQPSTPNGTHPNSPKSPAIDLKEQNRLENQRRLNSGTSMSGRTSQISVDIEQKLRRDIEHLQEQLEIHVQTIGILVAEKTDVSAKLTQSFKQLERKQSEMDELYGRLKASRERVQELEKEMQNSTSNVQKREMAAKESDKENDRLKIENIRQSQLIEDLKQNINQLNEKLHHRQNLIEQLNTELEQFKKSNNETSLTDGIKNNQIEELVSSINRIRSDNEQYQQYNTNMQQHILELNDQINQLNQTNHILQTQYDTIKINYEKKLSDHGVSFDHENLRQENELFRNANDQWSNRYEELKFKLEQTTKLLIEKDEYITQLQTNANNSKGSVNPSIQTGEQPANDDEQQQLIERFNRAMHENAELKDHIQHLEHTILQLQSETETIGDYIHLYQQQREQLQRRYQEKDDYIKQLTQDRIHLQKKISELESLFIENLTQLQESNNQMNSSTQSELNEHVESISDPSSTTDQPVSSNTDKTPNSTSLPQLSDEAKAHILALIKDLGQNNIFSISNASFSPIKLAFVDKNLYICSTCSGRVQWV